MDEVVEDEESPRITPSRLFRDRLLFFISLALIVVGGLGLALGSWLHDILHVPVVGTAYQAFGHINVLYATVGLIMFFIGLFLLFVSLRGGTLSPEEVRQVKTEGGVR
ncbi:MAG: hypothetical protein JSV43_03630 [Methanobacteriota archaeon]|nr:MAG: hypothetical protein JSV43_03630 [Euryarchaeota archaeon]